MELNAARVKRLSKERPFRALQGLANLLLLFLILHEIWLVFQYQPHRPADICITDLDLFWNSEGCSEVVSSTTLYSAASSGDLFAFRCHMLATIQNLRDEDGMTALFHAASGNQADLVRQMLRAGADANIPDKDERTPLWMAAFHGHSEVVKELLASGADVDKTDKDGTSPLLVAAQEGKLEVVRQLLAAGAGLALQSPLHVAAEMGHGGIVRVLLEAGASVDLTNEVGQAPLLIASANGHAEVVKELLASGANVDTTSKDGASPLHVAAQEGKLEVVRQLLAAGADVNHSKENDLSPLYIATCNGHKDVVRVLLAAGASVDTPNEEGRTPLWTAASNGYSEIAKELLAAGASVDKADKDGVSPLQVAALQLLAARINATEMDVAPERGHTDIFRMLLAGGASVDDVIYPLLLDVFYGSFKVAEDRTTPTTIVDENSTIPEPAAAVEISAEGVQAAGDGTQQHRSVVGAVVIGMNKGYGYTLSVAIVCALGYLLVWYSKKSKPRRQQRSEIITDSIPSSDHPRASEIPETLPEEIGRNPLLLVEGLNLKVDPSPATALDSDDEVPLVIKRQKSARREQRSEKMVFDELMEKDQLYRSSRRSRKSIISEIVKTTVSN